MANSGNPPYPIKLIERMKANTFTVGYITLMPFRPANLPSLWYHSNGDRFPVTSDQGQALISLDDDYKADFGVEEINGSINVPQMYSPDGRGYFIRAANGTWQAVGEVQEDAMRNFTGSVGLPIDNNVLVASLWSYEGVFSHKRNDSFLNAANMNTAVPRPSGIKLDPSTQVPTASENRPLNIGFTPAIFLGV
jgi:hypothetical protein